MFQNFKNVNLRSHPQKFSKTHFSRTADDNFDLNRLLTVN